MYDENQNFGEVRHSSAGDPWAIRETKHPVVAHFLIWSGYILLPLVLYLFAVINTNFDFSVSKNFGAQLISPRDTPSLLERQGADEYDFEQPVIEDGRVFNPSIYDLGTEPEKVDNEEFSVDFESAREDLMNINFTLGVLGILSLLLLIFGQFIGSYMLGSKVDIEGMEFDDRSGKGKGSEVPAGLSRYNFGALFFTFHWGLYYRIPFVIFYFTPVGLMFSIYLFFAGNKLAWQSRKWLSVYEFNHFSRRWNVVGLAVGLLSIAVAIFIWVKMGAWVG